MQAVIHEEFWIGGEAEDGLQIHAYAWLTPNEVGHGGGVFVPPFDLARAQPPVSRHFFGDARSGSNPHPACVGLPGRIRTQHGQVFTGFLDADDAFGRRLTVKARIVGANHSDDPVGFQVHDVEETRDDL